MIRLDKFLAQSTDFSRSEVKKAIKQQNVKINGVLASSSAMKITETDVVELFGTSVRYAQYRYYMLNKPEDIVSATRDRNHITAIDLLDVPNKERLHIAGRLDKDATGLLLLTDDGEWTHQIITPRKQCNKVYWVDVDRELAPELVEKFAQGIWLEGEKKRTHPAELEIISPLKARLVIHEGKYHQVKRMFAALGNHVHHLHRSQIGRIELDQSLAFGEYRSLSPMEIASISGHVDSGTA
ncbi:MAG: pseudouridine synthase [Gammaproteobacteria bacterium]|nr:pseudouridine synthase [Gammaproteobacteria bacterium]